MLKSLKHISKHVKGQLRRKEKFKASNLSASNFEIKDNNGHFILTPSNIRTPSYNIFSKYRSRNVFDILQEDDVFLTRNHTHHDSLQESSVIPSTIFSDNAIDTTITVLSSEIQDPEAHSDYDSDHHGSSQYGYHYYVPEQLYYLQITECSMSSDQDNMSNTVDSSLITPPSSSELKKKKKKKLTK